jgi:hypothetical protein
MSKSKIKRDPFYFLQLAEKELHLCIERLEKAVGNIDDLRELTGYKKEVIK